MGRISVKTLEAIVDIINAQVKEQYFLRKSNGGYSLYARYEGCGLSVSHFGNDMCLTANEMYYYLRGLQTAIGSIMWYGSRKLLKPKR